MPRSSAFTAKYINTLFSIEAGISTFAPGENW